MIRERCSCGAELETDEPHAIKLLNAWRKTHRHETSASRDIETSSSTDLADNDQTPRTSIGFTSDPWEDKRKG